MTDIGKLIRELTSLIGQLDDEDFEFNAESNIETGPIGSRPDKGSKPSEKKSSPHKKTGKDKFEARRKVKKVNRLLKKAEREGLSIEDIIKTEDPRIDVRISEGEDSATIIVDGEDANIDWYEGEDVIVVEIESKDITQTEQLPFEVGSVEEERNNDIHIFKIYSQG